MTKAEKIENLELQLKVALIELGEYRKKEERIVYAEALAHGLTVMQEPISCNPAGK